MKHPNPHRRALLALGIAPLATSATRGSAQDRQERSLTVEELIRRYVGSDPVIERGIHLHMPALADNGLVVPARLSVDSPMTDEDHVQQILLLSTRNPVSQIARFTLGPWSGRAEVATRVRLAGTQTVVALARLSRGGWRFAAIEVVVTESACLDMG
jgi:sulfur-oxidizing protein SoxY